MNHQTISEAISLAGSYAPKKEATLGKWTITSRQTVDKDYSAYSKAWHRQYGPKTTVINRSVTFSRQWGQSEREVTIGLPSWQGDFVARAVAQARKEHPGLFPLPAKERVAPMRIRLNAAYGAVRLPDRHGYKFYARTLLGHIVDYAVESPMGMTYHSRDRGQLIAGVHAKIRAQSRKLQGLIDWAKCKSLGFCDAGIKEFCSLFDLDPSGQYTAREVEQAVRADPAKARPFLGELRTLAAAMDYSINWEQPQ